MHIPNETIIVLFLTLNILCGLIGYIIGILKSSKGVYDSGPKSFFDKLKKDKLVNTAIAIDDKKFVTNIKTDGLEKKYDSLGETKQTEENISNSVNKLKNLKR